MVWFERLKELRVAAGLSCRELDRIAGTTIGYCWLLEHGGRRQTNGDILRKYASALGCTVDWMLTGAGKRPSDKSIRAAVIEATRIADSAA